MIMVGAPIKNRYKMLPYYLRCLENLQWPHDDLYFVFIDDCSTDGTLEYLYKWKDMHPNYYIDIIEQPIDVFGNNSSRIGVDQDRKELFVHLSYLRNRLLQWCRERSFISHQFIIDTDIWVCPNILKDLMATMKEHDLHYLASMIFNDAFCNNKFDYSPYNLEKRHVNFGIMVSEDGIQNFHYANFGYQMDHIYEGVITGACYLIDRKTITSGIDFSYHTFGEDISYCLDLYKAGINPAVQTVIKSVHVMDDKYISDALLAYEEVLRWQHSLMQN